MLTHFLKPERKEIIEKEYGVARYERMMHDLNNPMKIQLTFDTIIPGFLNEAVKALKEVRESVLA
jgi:hypothetical protein